MTFNLPFEQINAAQLETLKANAIREARQLDYKEMLPGNSDQDIRADILAGLIDDKGGEQQIGTAERILAEIISSDLALLVTFNQAIDGVLKNNQKAQISPHANVQCRP